LLGKKAETGGDLPVSRGCKLQELGCQAPTKKRWRVTGGVVKPTPAKSTQGTKPAATGGGEKDKDPERSQKGAISGGEMREVSMKTTPVPH